MKTAICTILMVTILFATSSLQAQDNWFDMQQCEICKCMGDHPEVMMDLKFGVHPIANGMVMVMVIPEKHQEVMKQAHEHMMEAVAKLEKGEKMELCGFCKSLGALKQAGATVEELDTVGGNLTIVTSTDEEVVAMIHKHANRSQVENEKLAKLMKGNEK